MFDYTKTALHKIYNDFLRIKKIFEVIAPLFSIAFLTYAVIAQTGIFIANCILLAVAVAYYVFHLVVTFRKTDKELVGGVKLTYKVCMRAIKFFTIAVAVYGLWFAVNDTDPTAMILNVLSLVGWLLGVVMDIISFIIGRYADLIKEAVEADVENIKKPLTAPRDFFKKMTGQSVEEKEISKTRERLDEMVATRKEELKTLKAEQKEQKKQEKRDEKERKRQEKRADKSTQDEVAVADSTAEQPKKKGFFSRFKKQD